MQHAYDATVRLMICHEMAYGRRRRLHATPHVVMPPGGRHAVSFLPDRDVSDMNEVPVSEIVSRWDQVLELVATGEIVYVTSGGERLAAVVPAEDAEVMEAREDAWLSGLATESLTESAPPIPHRQLLGP
jgi:antitoxin (DNA-binding transcriptional repressor) of toxin-antitoxin stability system